MTASATSTPQQIDLYRERREFFNSGRRPGLVDLQEAAYLIVEGKGSPDSPAFQEAIGALYSIAYAIKFNRKRTGTDFRVPTFEGTWWSGDEATVLDETLSESRDDWRWRLLLMLPDAIAEEEVAAAKLQMAAKKHGTAAVAFRRVRQGLCVQMMHVGPYDREDETLGQIGAYIKAHNLKRRGPHHEVYLGDPRRANPEALKTILRQPVEASAGDGP